MSWQPKGWEWLGKREAGLVVLAGLSNHEKRAEQIQRWRPLPADAIRDRCGPRPRPMAQSLHLLSEILQLVG
jgi:hypothetical protein